VSEVSEGGSVKPKWLEIADAERGQKEIKGGENPRIIEYHATTTLAAKEDEISWCSSFVNWCMEQAGIKGTGLANARSWLKWGCPLEIPVEGCIVILKRGAPPSGHVCFFLREDDTSIACLGGNQSDQVKVSVFKKADVLGYRWPNEATSA